MLSQIDNSHQMSKYRDGSLPSQGSLLSTWSTCCRERFQDIGIPGDKAVIAIIVGLSACNFEFCQQFFKNNNTCYLHRGVWSLVLMSGRTLFLYACGKYVLKYSCGRWRLLLAASLLCTSVTHCRVWQPFTSALCVINMHKCLAAAWSYSLSSWGLQLMVRVVFHITILFFLFLSLSQIPSQCYKSGTKQLRAEMLMLIFCPYHWSSLVALWNWFPAL